MTLKDVLSCPTDGIPVDLPTRDPSDDAVLAQASPRLKAPAKLQLVNLEVVHTFFNRLCLCGGYSGEEHFVDQVVRRLSHGDDADGAVLFVIDKEHVRTSMVVKGKLNVQDPLPAHASCWLPHLSSRRRRRDHACGVSSL